MSADDEEDDLVDQVLGSALEDAQVAAEEVRGFSQDADVFYRLRRAVADRVKALQTSLKYFMAAPDTPVMAVACARCGRGQVEGSVWNNNSIDGVYIRFVDNRVGVCCGGCGRLGTEVTFDPGDPRAQLEAGIRAVEVWNRMQAVTPPAERRAGPQEPKPFGEVGRRQVDV